MFSKIFIERPKLAIVVSLLLVLWGLLAIYQLPVAEYPEITPPQVVVSASYAGASAEVVKDTVAIPLEAEINNVDNLLYFSSSTDNSGTYSCKISFKPGTDSDIAMVNTQNAVKRAEQLLPEDVKRIGVNVETRNGDILAMFVFKTDGSSMSPMQLSNYVSTTVRDAVSRVDGVGSAEVMGAKTYAMRIWLNPVRMAGLGITTTDVSNAVRMQNIQAAAGTLGAEGGNDFIEYKINIQGRLKDVTEFENIVVRRDADGSILRLKDIARVELGAKTYNMQAENDGEEVVGLGVYRSNEANALDTVKRVKEVLNDFEKRFPEGVTYKIAYDPTEFIKINVREIIITLITALLLVVLITYLFLQDWRATLIPSVAIPVALLGTFPFLLAMGFSINVLTMFGLILVIGSLVDDAIVVVENTQALMHREGLSAKEAAIKSMTQITGAVIATTLVTLACYLPLAFYGGMVGKIYIQFSVTMCIALCISTGVALTLSPALCALLLRNQDQSEGEKFKIFRGVNFVLDTSKSYYLRAVGFLVRRSLLTAAILGGVFIAIFIFSKFTPSSFLPEEDKGVVMCEIQLAPGATLARTNEVIKEYRERVSKVKGVRTVMAVSGMGFMNGVGENNALIINDLEPWNDRKSSETKLKNIVQNIQMATATMTEPRIFCFTPPAIMGLGVTGGVTFSLSGEGDITPDELANITNEVSQKLNSNQEIFSRAMSTFYANTPQLVLDIDREKAELLGVTAGSIFSTLQSQLASYYINDFNMLGDSFYVKMQSEQDSRETIDNIRDIQLTNVDGDLVPLTSVATLRFIVGPQRIQRFNKYTSSEFTAYSASGVPTGTAMDFIEKLDLPRNFHIEWSNMSFQERNNQGQILKLMLLAVIFAYLFLVGQYESWSVPVPVMLTVATSVLGALIGLAITRLGTTWGIWDSDGSLSIYAQLGLVMLIGLSAKNAILMVEFSKTEKENGVPTNEAAVNGASLRFRAVLMTAWSFIFGVLPLVLATGAGSASRRAIGITTFSGMLMATFVGIIMTPALYAACEHCREWFKKLRKK